ncbi:rubrerythrin-like domain-containing protein [Halobellus sp. Atlit-31R]|nr:rubrerythrin-like domain-containing protein [Halobellus sp. Atlit-31R]
MVIYNGTVDPYHPQETRYECRTCGARAESDGVCDTCGGESLVNIAVPRE